MKSTADRSNLHSRMMGVCSLLIILTLMMGMSRAVHAQNHLTGNISGKVLSDRKPVVGATVRILELDRATYTDAAGEFSFSSIPTGDYQIFVRCVGYASRVNRIAVKDSTVELAVELHQSAIEASEIVVSASPYAQTTDELYQSSDSKTKVALHQTAGSSVAEEISDLPGIAVRYNGSAPARPIIRGLSDNEVLVLENGMRTGDVSTYDPAHSVPIEPMSVERVDVVRGPASIIYGPNAVGGLINVITNTIPSASSEKFSGTASLGGNSVSDEYSGYFNGVYSSGGHAFSLLAGGVHSQDTRIPAANYFDGVQSFDLNRMPQTFNHTQEEGAGYSYQGESGMAGIGFKHYEMRYGIPGTPPNPDWITDPPTTSLIAQNVNSVELRSVLESESGIVKQFRLDAGYVDYNHSEFPTQQDSSGISNPQANHFNNRSFNVMLQMHHREIGALRGTLGLWSNLENLSIEGDQPLGPNSFTTDLAGFIYEEYVASEKTRFQGAVRFDYNRIHAVPYSASTDPVFQSIDIVRTHEAVTASVGLIQNLAPGIVSSLNLARSFRPPTVQELFANGADAASNTYSVGDAALTPEAATGIDASLKGDLSGFIVEVSPYVNFISNYIYSYLRGDTMQDLPVRKFSATDARLVGFESRVAIQPLQSFAFSASADYVNAEDTKNRVPLPFTPPLRGLLSVTYRDDAYSGMIQWRLAAAQKRLGEGDTYTAGYGVVNIGFGIRLTEDRLVHNVSFNCDNLFNQVYRDNLSVIKDFVPQPARGFRLNYDLIF